MFQPTDTKRVHAVREAVFTASFNQVPLPPKLKILLEFGKENWKDRLPKAEQFQIAPMLHVPGAQNVSVRLSGGVSFQRFKDDGSLAWRVLVQDQLIAVNCLEYDRWDKVWPQAREYISQAVDILFGDDIGVGVSAATLQYVNAFHWIGEQGKVDLKSLIRENSDRIPPNFWKHTSPEWHLHQGWFDQADNPKGRILNREHMSTQIESVRGLTVLLDLMHRYDFADPHPAAADFMNDNAAGSSIFDTLRKISRRALRAYLTDNMIEEIKAEELE